MNILSDIQSAKAQGKKLLAILLDPDKIEADALDKISAAIAASPATHIFVGGSRVTIGKTDWLIGELRMRTALPIVLFPGHPSQISAKAHALLLLSLVSGRNPDFLIGHHVDAAHDLVSSGLEIIPTGYLLIDGAKQSAVEQVTQTKPLSDVDEIVNTALASQLLGHQLVYIEAGSGASIPVSAQIISKVASTLTVPLIVGGGINSARGIEEAHEAGATLVVIGTAFEEDLDFFQRQMSNVERRTIVPQ
jgi:geranylgeranylglyceryl phosphate synthase family protein